MQAIRIILEKILAEKTEDGKTKKEAFCEALVKRAIDGNLRAITMVLKILGEYPNKMTKEKPVLKPPKIIVQPVRPYSPELDGKGV